MVFIASDPPQPDQAPRPAQRPARITAGRSIAALGLREMVTTYGRSPGGWLWAVLEPVAAIALLSFAFSLAFHAPPLGSSFPLFYASGFLPYMLFHDISQKVAASIRFSRPLLSFGAVTYLDTLIARFLLNVLTHLVIISVVLSGILMLSGTGHYIEFHQISIALGGAAALAIGIGTLNCYLFNAFPAWERLWAIGLRPLFIISGVVFLFEDVPPDYQDLLVLNPLFHITGLMRAAIYPTYAPIYINMWFVFGLALASCVLGMLLLHRFHDELVHK
jgi:capsular polysaccharide transport system permease protein